MEEEMNEITVCMGYTCSDDQIMKDAILNNLTGVRSLIVSRQ